MRTTRSLALGAMILALLARVAGAQSVAQMIGNDFKGAVGDIWFVWTSPFHASAADYGDAAATLAISAAFLPVDDNVDHWIVTHHDNWALRAVRPFSQEGSLPLTGHQFLPVAGAMYVAGLAFHSQDLRDAVIGCLTSYGANNPVRQVVWHLVARERPDTAQGDQYRFSVPGSNDWEKQSFFGGHAANIMACASYWSHRFSLGYARPVVYLVAIGIGLGRMEDRGHWTSDTVLGFIFGYAVGRAIGNRAADRQDERRHGRLGMLEPPPGAYMRLEGRELVAGWRHRF